MENQEVKTLENNLPSANFAGREKRNRFGKIFYNMSIGCLSGVLFAFLSTLISPLLYIGALAILFCIVIVMVVFSLGAVFAMESKPVATVWGWLSNVANSGDVMQKVMAVCFEISKWLAIAGVVISAVAIVFVAIGRGKGKVGKLVFLSISVVALLVVFIIQMLSGGVNG